ncbi:MAG TPA: hypothetical protein VJK04_00120 [Candidatus Paceibacterota bacterium]
MTRKTATGKELKHPELRDREIYLINCTNIAFKDIGWKTKRKGHQCYDRRGPVQLTYGRKKLFPVFVKKSELLAKKVELKKVNSPLAVLLS